MRKPSRSELKLLLFALAAALIVNMLAFCAASYAYSHNLWPFVH